MRDLLDLHFLTVRGLCPDALWANVLARFDRAGYGDMAIGLLNALKAMAPTARLGPCPAGTGGARLRTARYLRRQRRFRLKDPTLYVDLMRREWHRLAALKAYRRQLWTHVGDPGYWRRRWRNPIEIIWRP